MILSTAEVAVLECMVLSTRCPVSAAWIAMAKLLVHVARFVLVQVFDGILYRDDISVPLPVVHVQNGGKGRRHSVPRRTFNED